MLLVALFLQYVAFIAAKKPAYKLGHCGLDGFCDCIGLIIGALKKGGIKWNGIHGSNYAARYRLRGGVRKVQSVSELRLGYLVFKGNTNPATSKLPARYKKGGALYNGDLTDYYHVGVVTSINPLVITHMTSPTIKRDTKLGQWEYFGECSLVDYSVQPEPQPTPVEETAVVWAPTGKTVNLRKGPGKNYRVLVRVPIGETVTVLGNETNWTHVRYNNYTGYMMSEFLRKEEG